MMFLVCRCYGGAWNIYSPDLYFNTQCHFYHAHVIEGFCHGFYEWVTRKTMPFISDLNQKMSDCCPNYYHRPISCPVSQHLTPQLSKIKLQIIVFFQQLPQMQWLPPTDFSARTLPEIPWGKPQNLNPMTNHKLPYK